MRRGFTLVEMVVAVVLLGLLTGVAGLALRSLDAGPDARVIGELQAARATAIHTGQPQVWTRDGSAVRFLPDGSASGGQVVVGATVVVIDALTGAVHAQR